MIRRSLYLAAIQFTLLLAIVASFSDIPTRAQSLGSAGTINGVVTDPNGAVVPNASITISNPITGYKRTAAADDTGAFVSPIFRLTTINSPFRPMDSPPRSKAFPFAHPCRSA
jgi:hypothetical protein